MDKRLSHIPMSEVEEDLDSDFEEYYDEYTDDDDVSVISSNPGGGGHEQFTDRPKSRPLSDEEFVALEMSKEPFNCNFNASSFNHMSRNEVLSVFGQVLGSIDPVHNMDPEHEKIEDMVDRVNEFLRVLGYRPTHCSLNEMLVGIEDGNNSVVVPIMAWLLRDKDEHKDRAYLGKYLVKMSIPLELCADEEVIIAYDKYEKLIEKFKSVHKENTKMGCNTPVSQVMDQIQTLQRNLTSVTRKKEAMKSRVESYPAMEDVIEKLSQLREQAVRNKRLRSEMKLEKAQLDQTMSHVKMLKSKRDELMNKNRGMNPHLLLEREEQELANLHQQLGSNIPKNIRAVERRIEAILKIENSESESETGKLTQFDILHLRRSVQAARQELEDELNSLEPKEESDELLFARQRASGIRAKRLALESKLHALEEDLEVQKSELLESRLKNSERIEQQDEIQALKTTIQTNVGRYGRKKAALKAVHKEHNVLASTKAILQNEYAASVRAVNAVEAELGLEGFFDATANPNSSKKKRPHPSKRALGDTSADFLNLTQLTEAVKRNVNPLAKKVNETRQKLCITRMSYDKLQKVYDSTKIQAECFLSNLQMRVNVLSEEIDMKELAFLQLKQEIKVLRVNHQRAIEEENTFLNKSRFQTFREKLLGQLIEQEQRESDLRAEEAQLETITKMNMKQIEYWSNTVKLLKSKIRLMGGGDGEGNTTQDQYQPTATIPEPNEQGDAFNETEVIISNHGDGQN